jgi:hypothetical protein
MAGLAQCLDHLITREQITTVVSVYDVVDFLTCNYLTLCLTALTEWAKGEDET